MTERKSGADYTAPQQRSTASTDDSYDASTDDKPNLSSADWPFGYSYSSPKTPGPTSISDARVTTVYDALATWLSEQPLRSSVTSANLVEECDYTQSTVGRALSALADDDACPIELTQWSSGAGSSPIRWEVRRVTSGDSDE
jgi:hypothetical protein